MARISYTVNGQNSCTLSVTELNTTTTYSSVYISCNGSRSGNLAYVDSRVATSRPWTITGLSAGTTYTASFEITSAGGTKATGSTNFTTESAPVVGGVGSVSVSNSGAGSIRVSWSSATNASEYRVELYDVYGNIVYSTNVSSTSTTVSGLSQGTFYEVKVFGRRTGSSNGIPSWAYITTETYAVGSVGTVYATPSSSIASVYLSWSNATNATYYEINVFTTSGSLYTSTTSNSTSVNIGGLQENTTYRVTVQGKQSGYTSGSISSATFTTVNLAPLAITSLSVVSSTAVKGRITMSWNSVQNATGYRWELFEGNVASIFTQIANGSTTNTSEIYGGLSEYTLYTVKVYAYRTGYPNGEAMTATVRTTDLTPPVLSNVEGRSDGRMYISFSASDAHSGLRTSNRYYTEISSKNGSTYGNGAFSNNTYRTFIADASGNEFEHNTYYYMRVTVYDNEGNSASSEVRVQFKRDRPIDWTWHTTKSIGLPISLTANEWNSFCTRINQFRQYKGYGNYNFTTVSRGDGITASVMNQARSAILAMTPPAAVPSLVVAKSTPITALYFNTLSRSLNSIQ